MLFDFVQDMGNYQDRCVGRDNYEWGFISTAAVSDGQQPFETAVRHTEYNNGKIVIVEAYDTREAALAGQGKWVKKMTSARPPRSLTDCANSHLQAMFGKEVFPRQVNKKTPK